MNVDGLNEMMQWLAEEINNLPLVEQMALANAFVEFAEKVKPIYVKHQLSEGTSTFLFKL